MNVKHVWRFCCELCVYFCVVFVFVGMIGIVWGKCVCGFVVVESITKNKIQIKIQLKVCARACAINLRTHVHTRNRIRDLYIYVYRII